METAAPKQRSPWLYVLLGCGGLAGLICLGSMVMLFAVGKAAKDFGEGVNDPAERQKNALKQLGAIPEGYTVAISVNMYFAETTILTDREVLPDGGFVLGDGHTFKYLRIMANENNKKGRDFLQGKETDPTSLNKNGVNIDPNDIVKRGQLTIDGRKFSYVASRGRLEMQGPNGEASLDTTILFECPGEQLQIGVWSQLDPSPGKTTEELDLAGTVADEAQLVKFLKPMNPCGK